MHRRVEAAKHVTPQQRGVEVAPYHDGLVPKRMGYQCLILDVFDTDTLRQKASEDAYISAEHRASIEPVDLVGSAGDIAALVAARGLTGQLDYVLSSHNLEHLPDPISFLHGCFEVLKPGGVLSMVLPDRRCTFDHFRPHSTTADLIDAFVEKRKRPSPKQVFTQQSLDCHFFENGTSSPGFQLFANLNHVTPQPRLAEAYREWTRMLAEPDTKYRDTHCWVFTSASFELALRDLDFLGLTDFDVLEVTDLRGHEFFVHLRKPLGGHVRPTAETFYAHRTQLLRRANLEAGVGSFLDLAFVGAVAREQEQRRRAEILETQVAALTAQVARLEANAAVVEQSHSWRLTRPLRAASEALRRFALNLEP